jgi:amino acid adenylation domain-containing protein
LPTDVRAEIAERKTELLDFVKQREAGKRLIPPPIKPHGSTRPAPLSFAQERLWFLEQLEPGKALYNICRVSRIVGHLSVSAVQASLNETVRRHEVLRSSISFANGRPVQIVNPAFEIAFSIEDLGELSDDEREPQILRRIEQAANQPFDFSAGRFLRAKLLRIKEDEHVLILITHHIVSDAWSLGILTRELWSLYEAYTAGNPFLLKDLQVQYSDFAAWQRDWFQGELLQQQVCYWKEQLKELTHLDLPTDRPRPARQSFQAARIPFTLPQTLTSAIHELSNESGVTPFMTLLAAFQVLLYRYCDQEDIVVGSPIANRARTELECLVGFFVNTLVLRSNVAGNPTFTDLLARVLAGCLGAYAHQDLPFEKLVQELQPQRDPSSNPLFQVLFVLQNATQALAGVPGLQIEPIERGNTLSQFDVSLFLRERDGKYVGYFEYSTDLFDGDTIERMSTHYQALLEAVVAEPDRPMATLPIMTKAETHKILIEWNETVTDYPKDKCIHHLFEEQAARTPEAIAVAFEDQQITYRDLNQRANQLAHYLITLGIGPEKLVGICVERSIEMVVGLLGILKAGGAYVPLDPAYPKERLGFMLEDSQVSILLTGQKLIEDREWTIDGGDARPSIFQPGLQVVRLDRDRPTIEQQSRNNPSQSIGSQNLAYVIYTSGSTGQPKGVQISHRNIINLLHTTKPIFSFNANDVWAGFHSYAFDFSVWEIWGCLFSGGRLVIVPHDITWSPKHFCELLREKEITILNQTPSAIGLLIDSQSSSAVLEPRHLRVIICGGEAMPKEIVAPLCKLGIPLWNFYGPTEATVWSTLYKVECSESVVQSVSIGRPLANIQTYILDTRLQPVPIGVPGELYIGGEGLARGYLNRRELTTKKFLPNPFDSDGVTKLYRTGDVAKYRPDGNIEFLGRTDDQVKVRGFRVELGEIKSILNQHSRVKDSAVIIRDVMADPALNDQNCESGSVRSCRDLVAYVVPKNNSSISVSELRNFLRQKVPDYMVPRFFVQLESLPLSPNGKIDRERLPSPHGSQQEQLSDSRTDTELLTAQAWKEILRLEEVGLDDSFFDLGGHSLLAIQLVSTLGTIFRLEIPVRTLFEAPTIRTLAAKIAALTRTDNDCKRPPMVPVRSRELFPLSYSQEHLWDLEQVLSNSSCSNVPFVYALSGSIETTTLQWSLIEIVNRHEALRTTFIRVDGRPVQLIKKSPDYDFEVLDFRKSTTSALKRAVDVILQERSHPLDITAGPLMRTKLLRLTDEQSLLLMTLHHIICDRWSMMVLTSELRLIYQAFAEHRPSPLAEVLFQFADFAAWERKEIDSTFMRAQLQYWTEQLSSLEFAAVNGSSRDISFRTEQHALALGDELFASMKVLAGKEKCTSFMILFSALCLTVWTFTGLTDIRIGTLLANRRQKETKFTIGNFVNTVVLRLKLNPSFRVSELLRVVRGVVLSAQEHQEYPFARLINTLEQQYGIDRTSLFQVMLLYQNPNFEFSKSRGPIIAPVNLRHVGVGAEVTITACDLIFDVTETVTSLAGALRFKWARFTEDEVSKISNFFRDALRAITSQPEAKISAICTHLQNKGSRTRT